MGFQGGLYRFQGFKVKVYADAGKTNRNLCAKKNKNK